MILYIDVYIIRFLIINMIQQKLYYSLIIIKEKDFMTGVGNPRPVRHI